MTPKIKLALKPPPHRNPPFLFPFLSFWQSMNGCFRWVIKAPRRYGKISEWKLRLVYPLVLADFWKAHMSPNLVFTDMGSFAWWLRIHGHCLFLKPRLITDKKSRFLQMWCSVLLSLQGDRRIMLMDFELILFLGINVKASKRICRKLRNMICLFI